MPLLNPQHRRNLPRTALLEILHPNRDLIRFGQPLHGIHQRVHRALLQNPRIRRHPDCEAQEQAIRDCNLAGVCAAGGNALEHCSGAVETPAICKTLREHGAVMAQMTGSGAAVFGIFDDENAARSAVAALKNGYKQVYLCKPTHGGPRVTVRRLFGAKK